MKKIIYFIILGFILIPISYSLATEENVNNMKKINTNIENNQISDNDENSIELDDSKKLDSEKEKINNTINNDSTINDDIENDTIVNVTTQEQQKIENDNVLMSINSENISNNEANNEKGELELNYSTHVQDIGWQEWKQNGEIAGTTGQSKRLEAIKIKLKNLPENAKIQYQVHIQDIGWQEWKQNGEIAGTTGQSKRLEAIKIKLIDMPEYSIEYRVHIQDIGWQEWKADGIFAGTTGESKRLEAIEIKISQKEKRFFLSYSSHIQNIGWMDFVNDGELSGTTGKSLRMEAIKIKTNNLPEGVKLKFSAHVQDIGWQGWKQDNEIMGTTGEEKRIEAFKIKLENTEKYSVAYRAHVQDLGWRDWVYDGEIAGTTGISKRIEAIQIKIVDKITEKRKIPIEKGIYGSSGLKIQGNQFGTNLEYYKIGTGPNVFFATFAIHGWEDDFNYDGQELTKIANNFRDRLIAMNDIDLANKWTIYIFPSVNPDGEYYGWTHNGPGRTTLYSAAPEHKGIDMNRTWSTDWVKYTTTRNYTGNEPFQAYEARYLREFLLANKSIHGQTILVDLHGWLFETMGDNGIGAYYRSEMGISKHISSYGRGYLINWARANLGSNGRTARSALIELPEAYSSADVDNWGLSDQYINATIKMLQEI